MKTTIDVTDSLLVQAKNSARDQGISLRTLFERGLRLALQPPSKADVADWPDLSFKPIQAGVLIPESEWREAVNDVPSWTVR